MDTQNKQANLFLSALHAIDALVADLNELIREDGRDEEITADDVELVKAVQNALSEARTIVRGPGHGATHKLRAATRRRVRSAS